MVCFESNLSDSNDRIYMYISIDYDKCYCSFECVPKAGSARLDSLISDHHFGLFNKYLITEIILQGYEKKYLN